MTETRRTYGWDEILPPEQREVMVEFLRQFRRPWPIVGSIEIAMRAGVHRSTVNKWRKMQDFPEPIADLASAAEVYWWPEVRLWLGMTGRTTRKPRSRQEIRPDKFHTAYRRRARRG